MAIPAAGKGNKALTLINKVDSLRSRFDTPEFKAQLKKAIIGELTPDRILRTAFTAAIKVPELADADPGTFALALLQSSAMGLEPDGVHGHLVPFRDTQRGIMTCQFIAGFQGYIQAAYKHPKVMSVMADAVYEADYFDYERGLNMKLVHRPYEGLDDPGALRAAYAICEIQGGGKAWVVLLPRDIERIKKSSRSANNPSSPWKLHTAAMWKKSAIRELAKYMPHSSSLQSMIESDDKVDTTDDYSGGPTIDLPQMDPPQDPPQDPPARVQQQQRSANPPAEPRETGQQQQPQTQQPQTTQQPAGSNTQAKTTGPAKPPLRAGDEQDLVKLENLVTEANIPVRQLLNWAQVKFNLSQLDQLGDLLEVAPRRLAEVVDRFAEYQSDICKAPAE